ncbi:hypothetical protein OTU49_011252, partial [Cherax quadricarinatus]
NGQRLNSGRRTIFFICVSNYSSSSSSFLLLLFFFFFFFFFLFFFFVFDTSASGQTHRKYNRRRHCHEIYLSSYSPFSPSSSPLSPSSLPSSSDTDMRYTVIYNIQESFLFSLIKLLLQQKCSYSQRKEMKEGSIVD